MNDFLLDLGMGAGLMLLGVNLADAAAHAFERYAKSTPGKRDDVRAAKILAATTALREFTDTVVALLRPFRGRRR